VLVYLAILDTGNFPMIFRYFELKWLVTKPGEMLFKEA